MTKTTPTSSELRAMLTRFIEAWNAHDVDGVLGFVTEDVIWVEPGSPTPLVGKAAVATSLRESLVAFPDLHFPLEDLQVYSAEDPAHVATSWTMMGTLTGKLMGFAPTGKAMRVTGMCAYELRDGLIARHTIVYDAVDAMQQIGLLPSYDSLAFKAQEAVQTIGATVRDLIKR